MNFKSRKDLLFLTLAGFFVTNAIVAELIGGKLIRFFGTFTQSVGIILWPVVFVLTDLINEHYGKSGVRKLTYITVGLIIYTYVLISVSMQVTAVEFSPVNDEQFRSVFGQSQWIIAGSIIAFFLSQLIDVYIFWLLKKLTAGKMIWLRATGSTAISQLIDTFTVQFVAFVVPGTWTMAELFSNASWGYVFKLLIAVAMTPVIYLAHHFIKVYLSNQHKEAPVAESAGDGITFTRE